MLTVKNMRQKNSLLLWKSSLNTEKKLAKNKTRYEMPKWVQHFLQLQPAILSSSLAAVVVVVTVAAVAAVAHRYTFSFGII